MSDALQYAWFRHATGRSYPIKRSELDAALVATPLTRLANVTLSDFNADAAPSEYFKARDLAVPHDLPGGPFRGLADATWWGLSHNAPGEQPAYLPASSVGWLSIKGVPREDRRQLNDLMVQEGLPRLLAWLQRIEQGAETERTEDRRYSLFLAGDQLRDTESGWRHR